MAKRTNEKFWHSGQNLETKYLESARRALNLSWIGGIYDCIVAREKLRKLMALFRSSYSIAKWMWLSENPASAARRPGVLLNLEVFLCPAAQCS